MNKLLTITLLALGLTLGGLAAAQTPLAFQSVAHVTSDLSLTLNETWAALSERGYSGTVTDITGASITYVFTRGEQELEITLRQTSTGVLVITRDISAPLIASR